ncbi:SDR family NAD(P)-dependent oxidoreductase [Burkholderia gladioli]|uniref:SDR family NAD(P)-dependent oxidoreductase n=1 Tax=Burkholderia gladioli TaxID=28095 RepID=UPI000BEF4ACA|nr:SDR family NAD(P)-dependent oxidoreductase [Burkholderia gladioli]PEH82526.1 short-chain dehydrogenase [Burkholderia gladioli]
MDGPEAVHICSNLPPALPTRLPSAVSLRIGRARVSQGPARSRLFHGIDTVGAIDTSPLTRAIVSGHMRGLGEAIAESLLERNIEVLGVSLAKHPTLSQRHPERFNEVALDLGDRERLLQWLGGEMFLRFVGGAQRVMLFNNASTVNPIGRLELQDPASVAHTIAVNVAAPLTLSAAFAKASAEAVDRRIVHISSGAAQISMAGWSLYCASKAALEQHARTVALDASDRLRICAIRPGKVDTNMLKEVCSADLERFPTRDAYLEMVRNDTVYTPREAATRIVNHALSNTFGEAPCMHVQDLP